MKNKLSVTLSFTVLFYLSSIGTISAQVKHNTHPSGKDSDREQAKAMIQTSDGGYAITGFIQSYGSSSSDVYVIKLDSTGKVQWTKSVGGTKNEEGSAIAQTKDGGYAIVGYTSSYGAGGEDIYVVKLDASGNLKWTKTIGGKSDDIGFSILETNDGGLLIAGSSDSYNKEYEYIIKLDNSGNIKWTTGIPGSANSIVQSNHGGYVICGAAIYPWQDHILVSKIDTLGNPKWNKVIIDSVISYGGIIHDLTK
jgi:hypothetical protein